MSEPDFDILPGIQKGEDGPVFNEPWEASAFALVVGLHERGLFEWSEWAEVLGEVIRSDNGATPYYELWLQALELMVSQKALVADNEVEIRSNEWKAALLATPHGKPIELKNAMNFQ